MATIRGTIRSAGVGVPNLTIKAFEEIKIGIELDDKPCQQSLPNIQQVGQATTDADGRYSLSFTPREEPPFACSFSAKARISVFDGGTLVWQSPKKTISQIVQFDHEILPAPMPEPEPSAVLTGVLTRCGEGAQGFRIIAFEEVIVGIETDLKPCRKTTNVRQIGSDVVDSNGHWSISYAPQPELPGLCFFSITVSVQAFDAAILVWSSPKRSFAPTVRFDHEFYPDCVPGSSLVRVVNELGERVQGAEVFLNGEVVAETDSVGQAYVSDLEPGDQLVARLRVLESMTNRAAHNEDSDQNWNYRVYITSLTLQHDEVGDNPNFAGFQVSDPTGVQELVVRRRNTLIGFNLLISVEWDAASEELSYYRDRFLDTSELMFNATDGQFVIERFTIVDAKQHWNDADYRIYANRDQPSNANVGAVAGKKGRVKMNPYDARYPGTLLHEFGHYGFFVRDEYKAADCWPEGEPVACTLKKFDPGTKFSDNGTKDSCLMRGNRMRNRKKICSAHRDNPHADCTAQGKEDCWSVIVEHYSGVPDWRIWSPLSRGAIVDRLPDSGVPKGTGAVLPSDADDPESFIPLSEWKPRWHIALRGRPDDLPDLIVRATVNGSPVNQAHVTLRTAEGRSLYQGVTASKNPTDAVGSANGEMVCRGAHSGDIVEVVLLDGGGLRAGKATIPPAGGPVEVQLNTIIPLPFIRAVSAPQEPVKLELEPLMCAYRTQQRSLPQPVVSVLTDGIEEYAIYQFDPDRRKKIGLLQMDMPVAEQDNEIQVTTFNEEGDSAMLRGEIAIRTLAVDQDWAISSMSEAIELIIPQGALCTPAQIIIQMDLSLPQPELNKNDDLLVTPHSIAASTGNALAKPALLHMQTGAAYLNTAEGCYSGSVIEILRYDEVENRWHALTCRINEEPFVATASIKELGVFALVRRQNK